MCKTGASHRGLQTRYHEWPLKEWGLRSLVFSTHWSIIMRVREEPHCELFLPEKWGTARMGQSRVTRTVAPVRKSGSCGGSVHGCPQEHAASSVRKSAGRLLPWEGGCSRHPPETPSKAQLPSGTAELAHPHCCRPCSVSRHPDPIVAFASPGSLRVSRLPTPVSLLKLCGLWAHRLPRHWTCLVPSVYTQRHWANRQNEEVSNPLLFWQQNPSACSNNDDDDDSKTKIISNVYWSLSMCRALRVFMHELISSSQQS